MKMKIRELTPLDAGLYRALRIQALSEWPPAFGSPVEEEEKKTISETEVFLEGSKNRRLFGAFKKSSLIGIVRYSRYSGSNEGHRSYIAGLYVDPSHRGQGNGRALLERCLREAKNDDSIRRVNLTVVSAQLAAIRLYESLGFVRCGTDYEAFRAKDQFFDELLMTMPIKKDDSNKCLEQSKKPSSEIR